MSTPVHVFVPRRLLFVDDVVCPTVHVIGLMLGQAANAAAAAASAAGCAPC